ncbi:MAG: DUF459 domain-containing protein [Myxococcota bacterium]|nr:DUF459 domain-containing protein [Myxococcota bacterium]
MKLRPSRYKTLTWNTNKQHSPTGALVGLWTVALGLGLYFSEDIVLADSGDTQTYPSLVSHLGKNLKDLSQILYIYDVQKEVSGAVHHFYASHHSVGDRSPPKPWLDNKKLGVSEPESPYMAEVCEDDQPTPPELPKRILLLGSSSMYSSMGVSLEKQLSAIDGVEVMRHAKPGTGLSRPDVYNWIEVSTELSKEHNADLVVAQFIGNDCQNLITVDKTVEAERQEDHWNSAYYKRVAAFVDAHQKLGADVVLIGMPIVRSKKFQRSLLNANQIVKSVAEETGAHFISTWEKTSDSSGRYTEALRLSNKTIKLRHDDGIHLSYKGAQFLAKYLAKELTEIYPWGENQNVALGNTQATEPVSSLISASQTEDANNTTLDTGLYGLKESSIAE